MKNTKLYYFLQIGIVAVSLITFIKFTYPYLNREEVKSSNELSEFLQHRSGDSDVDESLSPNAKPRASKPLARSYSPESSKRNLSDATDTFRQQIHVEGSGLVNINKKIESIKEEIQAAREEVKSAEGLTLDKVERFFKFTSSIVGTVFPLVGFTMTVLLWRNQRKEKKLQST